MRRWFSDSYNPKLADAFTCFQFNLLSNWIWCDAIRYETNASSADTHCSFLTWDRNAESYCEQKTHHRDDKTRCMWNWLWLSFGRVSVLQPCWWSVQRISDEAGRFFDTLRRIVRFTSLQCLIKWPTASKMSSATADTQDQSHHLTER